METPIVDPGDLNPYNYLAATGLDDNNAVPYICGHWYFYSSTCYGVYHVVAYESDTVQI